MSHKLHKYTIKKTKRKKQQKSKEGGGTINESEEQKFDQKVGGIKVDTNNNNVDINNSSEQNVNERVGENHSENHSESYYKKNLGRYHSESQYEEKKEDVLNSGENRQHEDTQKEVQPPTRFRVYEPRKLKFPTLNS